MDTTVVQVGILLLMFGAGYIWGKFRAWCKMDAGWRIRYSDMMVTDIKLDDLDRLQERSVCWMVWQLKRKDEHGQELCEGPEYKCFVN